MVIVYAYVCADILHVGHLLQLQNAKALGDKLIVGVLSDEAAMEKKSKPVLPLAERMQLVRSFGFVDCVVVQEEYSPVENVRKIRPDILMESASHDERDIEEARRIMESLGGRVIVTPYYPERSSTQIKNKIKETV